MVRRLVNVRYITLVNCWPASSRSCDPSESASLYEPACAGHEHVLLPEYPTWRDRSAEIAAARDRLADTMKSRGSG